MRVKPVHRFLCIHGHFYQPPRENPWLESIELQDSAYPYHDWNQRINAECYAPNADSRILEDSDRIVRIVNNYRKLSFNFGPTLLSWLEANDRDTYQAILEADRHSLARFSGHGSAIAQVYNHMILPLANARDKQTQVLWGLRDFEHRFGRRPEGMWLAETAVDLETLDVLARFGIRFTILAPTQAARVREISTPEWSDVGTAGIDPGMPYRVSLPSGRTIDLFFYDGPVSRAVAFERLLSRGDQFARRLLEAFPDDQASDRLMHIATDGETYGHHHRHGNMALAFALHHIESNARARLTNYGEYLALHPPTHEVAIRERTAWSCAHGVGRWSADCGCHTGQHDGWQQAWRAPLREALDGLRDALVPRYESAASRYLEEPWSARDDYIDLVLDRSPASIERFLERHARREFDRTDTVRTLKLLELQRQAQLMYTSCGWFFDEVSGIETVQIMLYAARALQLAEELFGESLEDPFLRVLERAPSNLPEYANGRTVYERRVLTAKVDLAKVGANVAAGLLFEDRDEPDTSSGFTVHRRELSRHRTGKSALIVGRLGVASRITLEAEELEFAFLHLGDHNLSGAVRPYRGESAYQAMATDLVESFSRVDLPGVLRRLEAQFPQATYSLQALFRDQQRRILDRILESTRLDAEAMQQRLYDLYAPLMRFLTSLDSPPPRALQVAAEIVLDRNLRQELEAPVLDPDRLERLLEEARTTGAALDHAGLALAARTALERLLARLEASPSDLTHLRTLHAATALLRSQPFEVDLRRVENGYYRLMQNVYPQIREDAEPGQPANEWVRLFDRLGETLRIAPE